MRAEESGGEPAAENALAPLLRAAAARLRRDDSAIAQRLSRAVATVLAHPVEGAPSQVPACAYLDGMLARGGDPLLAQVAAVADLIAWRLPGQGRLWPDLATRMAAAELVGQHGMLKSDRCRLGFMLLGPDVHYPEHSHAAEELYLVVSGIAQWSAGGAAPTPRPPGSFVHHPEWQTHMITTGEQPLLALWGWTGNLDFSTYSVSG